MINRALLLPKMTRANRWYGSFQHGSSLIVVLIMLTVIFAMGVIAARLSLFGEAAARNDREHLDEREIQG